MIKQASPETGSGEAGYGGDARGFMVKQGIRETDSREAGYSYDARSFMQSRTFGRQTAGKRLWRRRPELYDEAGTAGTKMTGARQMFSSGL